MGDVPGHQVRVYSVHYVYPQEAPVFDGVKVKEAWQRATSDFTNLTGHADGYYIYAGVPTRPTVGEYWFEQ